MGSFQQFSSKVDSVKSKIDSAVNKIETAKNKVSGWTGTIRQAASYQSSFIGINLNGAEQIRTEIRTYVKGIQDIAQKLDENADPKGAVASQAVQNATHRYLVAIKDMTNAYVSTLLTYADQMYLAAEKYKTSGAATASDLSSEADSVTSDASETTYTETETGTINATESAQ